MIHTKKKHKHDSDANKFISLALQIFSEETGMSHYVMRDRDGKLDKYFKTSVGRTIHTKSI